MDRAAHRRSDSQWLAQAWGRARVLVVDVVAGGRFLVDEQTRLVLLGPDEAPAADPEQRLFLGEDVGGTPYFALAGVLPAVPGSRAVNLRDVGHVLSDADAGLVTAGVALANWHAAHRYSPLSGRPTTVGDGGWVRAEDGGAQLWPRTDPAVIVLVHDGAAGPEGRCLLGHNGAWATEGGPRRFSCLAGFVEPGESAEAAVAREVAEEVGARVEAISYVASQAWPFPASLMLGFLALADPAQPLRTDPDEITHAGWFTRRDVGAVLAGQDVRLEDGVRLALPSPASIAFYLIRIWLGD